MSEVYGNFRYLGWGVGKYNSDYTEVLDFRPEFESKQDVVAFWKNRRNILNLQHMTIFKYTKILLCGIVRYGRLK